MTPEQQAQLEMAYRATYRKLRLLYRRLCAVPGGYKIAEMIEDDVRDQLQDEEAWEKKARRES